MNLETFGQRRFQLWAFTVSHALLLLRSPKSDEYPTRVDILFRGVWLLHVPVTFDGLVIAEVSRPDATAISSHAARVVDFSSKFFSLRTREGVGLIASATMDISEDSEDFAAPSSMVPTGEGLPVPLGF